MSPDEMDGLQCVVWFVLFYELFCCAWAGYGGWLLRDPAGGPWAVVIGATTLTMILVLANLLEQLRVRTAYTNFMLLAGQQQHSSTTEIQQYRRNQKARSSIVH